jgi:hypothetical protein
MASTHDAQLSALAATVDELAQRAAGLAAVLEVDGSSDAATALFEVERSLAMASRSVDRARRALER